MIANLAGRQTFAQKTSPILWATQVQGSNPTAGTTRIQSPTPLYGLYKPDRMIEVPCFYEVEEDQINVTTTQTLVTIFPDAPTSGHVFLITQFTYTPPA